jgi:uncharacterized lipoprotein
MNKRGREIIAAALTVMLLAGCSGMTHGFDEESPFYTKPASEHAAEKADETPKSSEKEEDKADDAPKTEVKKQEPGEENETTTFYDPDNMGE